MNVGPIESSEIVKIMSSSIAPVFLITGIASILSIMSLRYGRVVDRIRTLLRDGPKLYQREIGNDHLNRELKMLYKRARLLRVSIILEVAAIFCISATILAIFFSMTLQIEFYYAPQSFFVMALIFLIVGLGLFIRDYAISLTSIEEDMNVRSTVDMQGQQLESMFSKIK